MMKSQNGERPIVVSKSKLYPEAKVQDVDELTHRMYPELKSVRSPESIERNDVKHYEKIANRFMRDEPRFRTAISYAWLVERGKGRRNAPSAVKQATAAVETMKSWKPDPFSGVFQDKDGRALLAVFAYKSPEEDAPTQEGKKARGIDYGPYFTHYSAGPEGHPGRTEDDLAARQTGQTREEVEGSESEQHRSQKGGRKSVFHYGFTTRDVERITDYDQRLHSEITPHTHARDIRHLTDKAPYMKFTPGLVDDAEFHEESREFSGVTHLVHCWYAQGHPNETINPSRDMCGRHSVKGARAVRQYFINTKHQAMRLAVYFEAALPRVYAKYRRAFDAGYWYEEDPGPWIGRAIVWKLQVAPHVDGLDDGPTVAFPTGYFSGGEAYFPDLKLKLSYRPGDILLFLSGLLFHAVGTWTPTHSPRAAHNQTPGRVGHVFFFPKASVDILEDKPRGWANATAGDKYSDDRAVPREKAVKAAVEKRDKKRAKLE